MNFKEHYHSEDPDNDFATPPAFVRALARHLPGEQFDLDPASGAESAPLAAERYTEADDGLHQDWFGHVWLNPPWSDKEQTGDAKTRWLKKCLRELRGGTLNRLRSSSRRTRRRRGFTTTSVRRTSSPSWGLVG